MSDSTHDALVAQIEAAIEHGGTGEARRLIEDAERRLGRRPELDELRQRVSVVESALAGHGRAEAAIRRAREEMSRANYPGALGVLETALRLAPDDPALREMLQQTTRAALRHEGAVDRNRAVAQTTERIGDLIDRGHLETAMTELREANLKFGKHKALLALQERVDVLRKEAELERTVAFVDQARAFLDGRQSQTALKQAERILRIDPRNEEALEVRRRAQVQIEHEEAHRQAAQEIEDAGKDVERLMRADELARASHTLQEAVERLGRHDAFEDLARRLDQAKAELQAKKRLEWTQRRLKEAEDLVRQAGRLSLQGRYDEAIERLRQARELHPEHPEIADMLRSAETARQRALTERRRSEALAAAKTEIRQLLDALRLDAAAERLRVVRARFADDPDFQALLTRLRRLSEAETTGAPSAAPRDERTADEALAHQQELAAAYSWKQTLLFTFRGDGIKTFWVLLLLIVGLESLSALTGGGIVFRMLRWLVPIAVSAWYLAIVRETLRGRNLLPSWTLLADFRRRAADLVSALGIAVLAATPLLLLVLTRGWHTLFATATGWWLAALLGWWAAAAGVVASAVTAAFSYRYLFHVGRHLRAWRPGEPETLLAVNLIFATGLVVTILRATFLPFIPWMGSPLAAAIEVYALLTVPHLVGVVARRHHIELSRVYT